jgi:hypothetical protein
MSFIKLSNTWFRTESEEQSLLQKYGCRGLITLATMCINLNNNNIIIFRISDIYETLNALKGNTTKREYITTSLLEMNNNIYTIYKDGSCLTPVCENLNSTITYYAKLISNLDNNFFIINLSEIYKIVDVSKNNKLKFGNLFTYFSYIIKNIGNNEKKENYKVCFPSFKAINENTGISKTTMIIYNTLLKENELLLVGNAGKEHDEQNIVNLYARPKDNDQFDKALKLQKEKIKFQYNYKYEQLQEDKQRSLKQKINNYKKTIDVINITEEQWNQLNKLERDWHTHLTIIRNKPMFRAGLITIDMEGKDKSYYSSSNYS